ncbi:ATP-dependent bile acid permease [Aspergillus udagawae]|uniref:ATP-dependent bile acid permease n=1 Tax=Aspergillus udagawae TaxID=91492 RepID=A0A8H3XQ47_9EURO|nr:ATP-dependent bile acid permease [Aspergillus udagawae]
MQTLAAFCLIADISSTTLVVLLTVPAIQTLLESAVRRFHGLNRYLCEYYVDQDGEADRASIAASRKKFERVFIMIAVIIGGITASTRAIVPGAMFSFNIWAQIVHWLLQLIQSTALAIENSPTARYSLGWKQALSASVAITSLAWELFARYKIGLLDDLHSYTMGVEIGAAILIVIIGLSLPRRPDVYRHGTLVDRELTTSFLGRMTFSWTDLLIRQVSRKSGGNIDHLPELGFDTRAENLQESFAQSHAKASCHGKGRTPLWKTLVFSNRRHLLYQLALSVPASFLAFGPHLSLLQILRVLEKRSGTEDGTADLWFWVLALGICTSLSAWLEVWIGWIASNKLAIRVYEQLSAVMFNNALHSIASSQDDLKGNGKEDCAQGTQVAVNLVAVDVPRIAGIATFLYSFVLAPMKLGVACGLLQHVLGWKSLLAGMTTLALLMLLNHACMARYTRAGKDLMACRDHKIIALTEALRGIRQIKFSAAEDRWEEQLNQLRDAELLAQATSFRWNVICFSLWVLAPILLSAASLSVYAISHGELTASVAFTAISALTSIETALSTLPELITNATDAMISIKRIGNFLDTPERNSSVVPSPSIRFDNATVAWPDSAQISDVPSETYFLLRNLTVHFPEHGLSLVCGRTGAGKSLLLAAILGECKILDGTVKRPSAISSRSMYKLPRTGQDWIIDSATAYVAQSPWIEAATFRQNILFGMPFNEERYRKVLFACALVRDLQILEDGDLTEVGPNGVNLSGGQKARISLARALYSRAGIIIMDDIFSAVDVHTAQHLYEHALTGELATRRTRILVTHHVRLCLPQVDYVAYLDNGNLIFAGSLAQMRNSSVLGELFGEQFDVDNTAAGYENPEASRFQDSSPCSNERCRGYPADHGLAEHPRVSKHSRKFVEEEVLEKGAIPLSVFRAYIQKCGGWRAWVVLALCFATYTGLVLGKGRWLGLWSEQKSSLLASSGVSPELRFYLGVYIALSAIVWIVGSLRSYLALTASLQASRRLFSQVLHAILRAPLRWLDTVPLGRILNRFTADFNMIDSRLGFDTTLLLGEGMQALGAVIAGILVSPIIIIFSGIVAWVCGWYARQYLATARQLKRLESISRSPIYELLASSISGLWTIRSYQRVDSFVDRMHGLIDRHARVYWNLCLLNHWLNLRINISGALFTTAAAMTLTLLQDLKASSAGFGISFIIQLSAALAMAVRMYVMFDLDMNCVERVLEYSDIKTERYDGQDAPAAWPSKGRLQVENLSVGYAPNDPLVLRGISFDVEPNERIGIVGRTGAGKSSLALALFRFLEAREGRILIDGVDISQIKLGHLRRRMGIIPQDPTLFAGTIRSNLDPFQEHDDSDLLAVLDHVQWLAQDGSRPSAGKETAAKGPSCQSSSSDLLQEKTHLSPLDARVAGGGSNLSQGQRQLLCLARAMLSAPKILVLDEATSAVDTATDKVIQKSIRSDFGQGSTTMLVIAHRISTVADFDRILVLDAGKVVEFASPRVLMQLKDGIFRRMVEEDGESEYLRGVIFGNVSL